MPSPASTRALPRRPSRTKRRLLAVTSLGLAGLLAGLLAGCSSSTFSGSSPGAASFAQVSGNWQFSSVSPAAVRLSAVGGHLSVSGTTVTALLHPLSTTNQCLPVSATLTASGSIDSSGLLTLSGPAANGTLNLSGTLSADRRSLASATYSISGGACAVASPQIASPRDATSPTVTAQQYQPLNGTYTGTLTTADGEKFPLTSILTQLTQPDVDGFYHLEGTASSPGNPCVPASLLASASTVAGGSISATYTDAPGNTSITGAGVSTPDGSTITISSWTISSPCGTETGTGVLTRF